MMQLVLLYQLCRDTIGSVVHCVYSTEQTRSFIRINNFNQKHSVHLELIVRRYTKNVLLHNEVLFAFVVS